jgi:amino acid transporter
MAIALRAILALLVDLAVCYLCGELVLYHFYKRIRHILTNVLVGFVLCQVVFEVITLACYFLGKGLAEVTVCWLVVAGIMSVFGMITHIRDKKRSDSRKKHGKWLAVMVTVAFVCVFCYYVSVNGEINADSRYYISMVSAKGACHIRDSQCNVV